MSLTKKIVFYFLGFLLPVTIIVACYVIVEGFSRYSLCGGIANDCQYEKLHWRSGQQWKLDARGNLSERDPIPIDMFLGWSYEPSTVFWNISVGDDGYIKTKESINEHSVQTKKIVLLGGSTMAGAGASSFEFTIASELQKLLDENGFKYKVINAGTGGWLSTNQLAYLVNRLPYEEDVDLVVFFDGYNDLMRGFLPRAHWDSHVLASRSRIERARKLENGDVLEAAQHLAASIVNTPILTPSKHYFGMLLDQNSRELENEKSESLFQLKDIDGCNADGSFQNEEHFRNTKLAQAISTEMGVQFQHYFQPLISYKQNLVKSEFEVSEERLQRMFGSDWLALRGICYLDYQKKYVDSYREKFGSIEYSTDLSNIFQNNNDEVFFDIAHYTDEGNQIIASAIFEDLRAKELIQKEQ